jgi:hypothetical protein
VKYYKKEDHYMAQKKKKSTAPKKKSRQTNYIAPSLLELPFVQPEVDLLKKVGTRGRPLAQDNQSVLNFFAFLSLELYTRSALHRRNRDYFAITQGFLLSMFGSKGYRKIIHQNHFFNRYFELELKGDEAKGASQWSINPELQLQLEPALLDMISKDYFYEFNYGEPFQEPYNIADQYRRDEPKHSHWTSCRVDCEIPLEGLNILDKIELFKVRRSVDSSGYIKLYYRENQPHQRLYNTGHVNLQLLKKNVRNSLLKGSYDYDMVNAMPTIMLEDFKRRNKRTVLLRSLEEYVENSRAVRTQIAKETGISYSLVKQILISAFYGGNVDYYAGGLNKNLRETLGDGFEVLQEALRASSLYQNVVKDFRTISGGFKKTTKQRAAQVMCEAYFKHERTVLDSMAQYLFKVGNNPELLIFDGLVVKHEVDIGELEKHIKKTTDFKVKLEGTPLGRGTPIYESLIA